MKLHELDVQRRKEQIAKIFESHLGARVDFNRLTPNQARSMLQRVRSLVKEHRTSPSFHYSERNPDYMKLVMMEQGLVDVLKEMDMMGATGKPGGIVAIDVKDPKTVAIMKKAQAGQVLNPEEQKTVTAIASMPKRESVKPKRMVRESEVQQAQVVLAAQDMIDQLQKMMEQISEMQFKDLPALTDSIKNDPNLGPDKATQYQSQAATALTQLLAAIQQGKMGLEGAQGVLTGAAPAVPGVDVDATGADMGAMPDADVDVDAEVDVDADDETGALPPAASLGRERR